MKRIAKIILFVLLVIVVIAGSLLYKHRNSVEAFIDALKYSNEELLEKLQSNKDDVQKFIDETEDVTVRDLTEEESKALTQGNLSEEEVIKIITGKKEEEKVPDNPTIDSKKPSDKEEIPPNEVSKNGKTSGEKVSEAIAKLYVQKSIYLNKLDEVEAEVRAYFEGLEDDYRENKQYFTQEERKAVKTRLLNEYLPRVAAWETECDNMVEGILSEIEVALKEGNGDLKIVDKLREAYLNEKRTKKSYFINRYMD